MITVSINCYKLCGQSCSESLTSVQGGFVSTQEYSEIVCSTYAGLMIKTFIGDYNWFRKLEFVQNFVDIDIFGSILTFHTMISITLLHQNSPKLWENYYKTIFRSMKLFNFMIGWVLSFTNEPQIQRQSWPISTRHPRQLQTSRATIMTKNWQPQVSH